MTAYDNRLLRRKVALRPLGITILLKRGDKRAVPAVVHASTLSRLMLRSEQLEAELAILTGASVYHG